ncbi:MAG: WD40 repeat domain-containing protein, partial [Myxococcaceae bacterium]
ERARTAESDSDWALAAAYFGAARTKHDTAEARWGVALAGERAIERILSLRGPADSYTDVGVLPDGRVITLAASATQVAVRELESGRVLWTHGEKLIAAAALLPGGQVRLSLPDGWAFFAAATGKQLGMFDRNTDGRPCPGPYPTPVTLLGGKLLARVENGPPRVLATDVGAGVAFCVVSDDARLVAYQDTSERVRLLSVADGRSLGERSASGLQNFLFSSHGLVVVRKGWLDVLGAPEGDFSVRLADPPIQGRASNPLGGVRASPNGHLVAVTRSGANRSDLVDLRTRTVRGTIHHSPGWPRFAFSSDGERVFAAGLRGASELAAWRLPRDESPPGHPGHWNAISPEFSPSGRRIVLADAGRAVEVFGEHGELLDSEPISSTPTGISFAGEDTIFVNDFNTDGLWLRDVVQHRMVWKHHCRSCNVEGTSADGSRISTTGLDGVEVWDLRANRVLFAEIVRLSGFETRIALSPDGRRVAWTAGARAYVRDLESAEEKTLLLDEKPLRIRFSPDSSRLAVVTPERIALWNVRSAQALWAVSHPTTGDSSVEVGWTSDRRSILVRYPGLGTELFDTETGERLALFPTPGSALPLFTLVSPDLHTQLSVNETGWELRPLPQPASDSPAEGLKKTLRKTGLALQGVEVVAAP